MARHDPDGIGVPLGGAGAYQSSAATSSTTSAYALGGARGYVYDAPATATATTASSTRGSETFRAYDDSRNLSRPNASASDVDLAANVASTTIRGANFTLSGTRKIKQIKSRDWTERIVDNTIEAPYTTRAATNKATGGPATAYYRQSGAHVIIDDATGEVIQLSNRRNPASWIPDSSIIDPYRPGGVDGP